jgi:hypothetical protein
VFAIGISFLDFLYDNREKLEKDKRFSSFYELFLNMTNVNPNQQFDLAQTIAVIDIIITAEVRVVD